MKSAFRISDALAFGWKKLVENLGGVLIIAIGIFIVSSLLTQMTDGSVLVQIINIAINYFAMFTFVRIGLKLYKGEKVEPKKVFDFDWVMFGNYILAAVVTTLLTGIGFILLIIPGIYIMIKLSLFSYALIDDNLKPIDSLKRSMNLTKNHFWILLGFSAVVTLLNFAGALLFGIGLLITAPLSLFATVYVYQKLKDSLVVAQASQVAPTVASPAP